MKNKKFEDAEWGKKESTYKQEIYFKSGIVLTGYSKRIAFEEKIDKIDALTNWICRMYRDGYLDQSNKRVDPIDHIAYSYNKSGETLFQLYYTHCEWQLSERMLDHPQLEKLIRFIDTFYWLIKESRGSEIYQQLFVGRSVPKKIDHFNLSQKRFMSEAELIRYCTMLKYDKKLPEGQVHDFYYKYCERYFSQRKDVPNAETLAANFKFK